MIVRTQAEIMQSWSGSVDPVASICCITYNHGDYISQAIDSFLMQETDFPFEILVHDDASTDVTTEIILQYEEKYPNIIRPIIQTENQYVKAGLINPRFVFPQTRGKYIAMCEGDDYWTDRTKLQKQVRFLERYPEYVITYTDCSPFDDSGPLDINFGGITHDLSAEELQQGPPLYTLTTCFRNVIKDVPVDLMPARLGDMVIWSLLGSYGKGKYISDISPAAYRVHPGGVYSTKSKQQKFKQGLITRFSLFSYHSRFNNDKLAQYFLEKIFLELVKGLGLKRLIVLSFAVLARKIKKFFHAISVLFVFSKY